jgi:hypothetical protein
MPWQIKRAVVDVACLHKQITNSHSHQAQQNEVPNQPHKYQLANQLQTL